MRFTTNCSDDSRLILVAAAGFSATSPPQILALAQFLASSFIVLVSIANLPKRPAAHLLHGLVLVPLSGVRKRVTGIAGAPCRLLAMGLSVESCAYLWIPAFS